MKKLLTLAALVSIFFFGCDQGTDITSPADRDNHSYQLIKLPPKKGGLAVETIFSETKTINGEKGGEVKIKEEYKAEDGHKVKIDVKLKIKKGSFAGDVDITLTADNEFALVSFTPRMVFDVPAELDAKFEGIDLKSLRLSEKDYDFVFIADDGTIEVVGYKNIKIKEDKGMIEVKKALINHVDFKSQLSLPFSRYGFVN